MYVPDVRTETFFWRNLISEASTSRHVWVSGVTAENCSLNRYLRLMRVFPRFPGSRLIRHGNSYTDCSMRRMAASEMLLNFSTRQNYSSACGVISLTITRRHRMSSFHTWKRWLVVVSMTNWAEDFVAIVPTVSGKFHISRKCCTMLHLYADVWLVTKNPLFKHGLRHWCLIHWIW